MKKKNLIILFSFVLVFIVFISFFAIKKNTSSKGLPSAKKEDSFLEILDRKGEDYFKEKDFKRAISCWQKVLESNPKNLEIYQKIGVAYVNDNRIEDAIDIYEKGLKIDNKNADLYYELAFCQFLKNDYSSSLENLDKLLDLNQHYPEAHYLKGLIYEKQGLEKLAYDQFILEINMNPSCVSAWEKIKGGKVE